MSFVKKMLGQRGSEDAGQTQDNNLGLMHLRKLFTEFRHPTVKATQKNQEEKLYSMLPLFIKVFEKSQSSEMSDKWSDVLQFCSHVSKLMVTEIRRRASNQSTEAASCAIVQLLEMESTAESGSGWMLLTAINLLSQGGNTLIDCMTAASLPSTLVKCLYLFFDLPPVENGDQLELGCEFSPLEKRILLQKVFVQILVRLCNHSSPAEELARKDDLSLLFSAITSWCPAHNVMWRQSAGEVLVTLSRHGLTQQVVTYIHEKGCVRHCIENMQRAQDLSPLELVEMFVTVFCFLKDSSEVSQTLLDDFRSCQGYVFLSEFLLGLEQDTAEESIQALRNLVLLVGSLTTCGFTEMKPSHSNSGSLFQLPGFSIPNPSGKGVSVRNLQAFLVLQSVFLKSNTSPLCNTILDVISSIYHQDNANYFILESQHTLPQFAEKIYLKPVDIQVKFFELLEFLVFNLNFVPCKELISVSLLIKSQNSIECSILCLKSLLRILRYHSIYRDVFREVGMLEVLGTCLHRYAAQLKEQQSEQDPPSLSEEQKELGMLVMEALAVLLSNNSQNAGVFRECGGARCAHNMVPFQTCRAQALHIVQQLVLSPGGDDDMGTLLGLMPTASITDLELKTHILKSLLSVLRESHRTRTVFRKVGGFVYVMSVLVSMEGCLNDPPKAPWDTVERKDILTMLRTVFSTLTVAMRYEPANAKFFASEVRYDSLTEAIRLLGCFSETVDIPAAPEDLTSSESQENFSSIFAHCKEEKANPSIPTLLISATIILRFLYDMALDAFDKPSQLKNESPCLKKHTSVIEESSTNSLSSSPPTPNVSSRPKSGSTGSLSLSILSGPDPLLIHSGAVLSIFHLLPALEDSSSPQSSLDLKVFVADLLKSLLRHERNQQIMCDAGFPHELLSHGSAALADESHPLHTHLQYMFERLASQSLTPRDLRDFLRLGAPLSCRSVGKDFADDRCLAFVDFDGMTSSLGMEEKPATVETEKRLKSAGGTVPLTRVKCLVSMTTPRDSRMHGSTVTPAFVEFDMSAEGFSCLYLPSIAPQGPPAPSVVGGVGAAEPAVIGGIGTGERVFPPQSGLTFTTWFCVDKFSVFASDAHPVRLLTVVRNLQGRDENLICLSVSLMSKDRALIVTTQENYMPNSGNGCEIEQEPPLNDSTVRFWCPELTQEGQWHHLVVVLHRAGIMKNSNISLFVDGELLSPQKLHYISPNLGGGGTASPTAFTSVFAYIGTPPQLRRQSRLLWRQGPCFMLEDIISPALVKNFFDLGPTYVGSMQAPLTEDGDVNGPFIGEEKVMFGVFAHAMSQMTIAKIRKIYNKVDSKTIAKQLAMSAHENATPIRILHNSAGHLAGPARCLGAVLMGYLGVRTFCPSPVARMLENVGGTSALLGLIAMAKDVESLYAAVKALVCVVRSHTSAKWDMARIQGYQLLAMLYKKKRNLLNSHILHLTFSLVGTLDSGRETAVIPNLNAFQDLLCDLEIWHEAPGDLQRSLYEHFYELLTDSSEVKSNHSIMRQMGLINKLLHILHDPRLPLQTVQTIANVLSELLSGPLDQNGLLRFGQFLVSTLPVASCMEKCLDSISLQQDTSGTDEGDEDGTLALMVHNIEMRNMLLEVILKLVKSGASGTGVNQQSCEDMQRILGYDWLLLFMQINLHADTVTLALQILVVTFRNLENIKRFREGSFGGGWMGGTETVLRNQMSTMLGFNVGASAKDHDREISHDVCHVPGFQALQWLLSRHTGVVDVYYLLMALLLGQQTRNLKSDGQPLNIDSVWNVIFGISSSKLSQILSREGMDMCPDAVLVLLAMIRHMLNADDKDIPSSSPLAFLQSDETQCSVTVIQFLTYLYHNIAEFQVICTSSDFLCGLVSTLFPYPPTDSGSDVTTPQEEFKPFPDSEGLSIVKSSPDDTAGFLTGHPARRFIIDFIRTIIMDSLSQMSNSKSSTVLDIMLDASPEHASRAQQKEFQTEMLKILMEHMLASDVLLGDQAALPIMSGSGYSQIVTSVFYLASRIVDKMWHGIFTRDSKEVFEFLSKLISQAKRKSTGISIEPLYRCLNRTVLFQLSRPIDSVASQTSILDALHVITNNKNLVLGPGNHDNEFLGCLCYCLLQLTEDPEMSGANLSEAKPRMTTWHVDPDVKDNDLKSTGDGTGDRDGKEVAPALQQGLHLVAGAAKRVWDELYICKKHVLEDIFRIQFNNNSPTKSIATPDLNVFRLMIQEQASRIWVAYAENERKSSFLQFEKLQNQIQSKLQKVGSGVTGVLRLASRRTKRDFPLKSSPVSNIHMNDFYLATINHTTVVKDVTHYQHGQYLQTQKYLEKYLTDDWNQVEKELLRVRSLWGPPTGSRLDKYILDVTEGPSRMRKKMMKNDVFYRLYPFRPNLEESPLRYKVAISNDSKEYYENFWPQGILCKEALPIQGTSDADLISTDTEIPRGSAEDVNNLKKLLPKSSLTSTKSTGEDDDNDDLSNIDSQTAELERTESTTDRPDREGSSTDMSDVPPPNTKADNRTILHFIGEKEKISHMFRCARIQGLDTAEGLLLFGKDHFYVIDGFTLLRTKEIKDIDSLPQEVLHDPIIPKSSVGSGGNLKRMYSRFAYDDIREVHKRRYLLQPIAIEVFSGDGRNHLLAFPRKIRNKVLAKFLSVATAMTDNAQNSVSGQKQNAKVEAGGGIISNLIGEKSVTQRWEKGEISNFQYLMHLNTLAGRSYNDLMQYPVFPWIIANYDVEDLDLNKAANFRDLSKPMGAQTPDRLRQFQKRYTEWDDPQGETPPYHYGTHYSSAMIVASYLVRMEPFTQHFLKLQGGHFDLADRMFHSIGENWLSASKNNMADVKELIPEFFYLPDFLLNKNNFDLGTKQNGVALGDVILPPWAKGDPKEFIRIHREALECDYVSAHLHEWIDLIFGYKQCGPTAVDAVNVFHHLFYEGNVDIYSIDDPLKKNATIGFINNFGQIPKQLFKKPHPQKRLNNTMPSVFFHHVDNLKPAMQPIKELKGAVGQIHHTDKYLLAVEQNKVLIPPLYSRHLAWGFSDLSIRIGHYESDKAVIVFEGLDNGEILCASCPNDKIFVTGGTSCVVNVWEYSSKERKAILKQPLYGHTEPVTCLTSSAAYSLIISGSRDRTCILWDMSRLAYAIQLRGHVAPVAAVAINDLTGDIATCAGTFLHIWNVNGEAIASVNTATGRNQQILCVAMSQFNEWDEQNVILTGSSDGVVRMWSVEYVQVPKDPSVLSSQMASNAKDETDSSPTSHSSQAMNMARKLSHHSNTEFRSAIRRLSRHGSCDSYSDGKPAADLLKDFKDPDYLSAIECELGSSGEHDSPLSARMREEEREGWDEKGPYSTTLSTRSSSSDLSRPAGEDNASVEEGGDNRSNQSAGVDSTDGADNQSESAEMRASSDGTLNAAEETNDEIKRSGSSHSDFEIISEADVVDAKKRPHSIHGDLMSKYKPLTKNTLREGFCWQRQLVFRSKLTMHTAYERKDNKEPASITAIAVSKDHKGVYVGDVKGRIWSWTVTNQPGRVVADHWVKDDGAESCPTCGVRFSFAERKHHCRNCGHVFCSKCSCFETEIRRLRILKPVRVCQACYNILKVQQASDNKD